MFLKVTTFTRIIKAIKKLYRKFDYLIFGNLTPHQKILVFIAFAVLIVFICFITLNAIHKEKILPKQNLKRGIAEQHYEAKQIIRQTRHTKDPELQLSEIKRQRLLKEDMDREARRTPTKFWLYEKLRELFR